MPALTHRSEAHTMSTLAAFLLLWGLSLGPAAEAATFFETRPDLWAEAGKLQDPWANLTLVCRAPLVTTNFQLFKDGVLQELAQLEEGASEQRFPLGAVTGATQGLYRCRYALGEDRWTSLSNLLEVTGPGTLPAPQLSSKPVSWVTPGLTTTLLCRAALPGVTFLLRREGDPQFLEVAEPPQATEAAFTVHQAGNYSCSYRTHESGTPSEPSAILTLEEMARPPPPELSLKGESVAVLAPGAQVSLGCVAPLERVELQLRRGERELEVPRWSSTPGRVTFQLEALQPEDGGVYTCRYRVRGAGAAWSPDSAPVELLLSDDTLPAPQLSAEPRSPPPQPGARVELRCRAPRNGRRNGRRFALLQEDAGGRRRVRGVQSPAGPEARFELRDVTALDGGNYSCVYLGPAPPAGSAPSARLELRLDGLLPKPRLRPLWSGKVSPGRDAPLRCETSVPHESMELLGAGVVMVSSSSPSEDLVLTYVGPQHAGNYSCRYRSRWPLVSELSDPVELRVAGH